MSAIRRTCEYVRIRAPRPDASKFETHYIARRALPPATVVRPATLQSKRTGFLRAYACISTRATVPLQVSWLPTITDSEQVDQLRDYADSRLLSGCIYCIWPRFAPFADNQAIFRSTAN